MKKKKIKMALLIAGILLFVLLILAIVARDSSEDEDLYPQMEEWELEEITEAQENVYEEIARTTIEIQAREISNLIQKEWNIRDVNLGTRESDMDGYDIYFDEGIEVKTVASKVFNIVFTKKYTTAIVNNLKVGATYEEITETLGKPTFNETYEYYDDEGKVHNHFLIGYKGEEIYVFFTEEEVSIYRVEKDVDTTKLIEALEEFETEENIFNLGNTLTDIWPDYDNYIYDETHVILRYALRGFQFCYGYGREDGLTFYNNFSGKLQDELTLKELVDTEATLLYDINIKGDTDLVFETEKERFYTMLRKL